MDYMIALIEEERSFYGVVETHGNILLLLESVQDVDGFDACCEGPNRTPDHS